MKLALYLRHPSAKSKLKELKPDQLVRVVEALATLVVKVVSLPRGASACLPACLPAPEPGHLPSPAWPSFLWLTDMHAR